MRWGSPSTLMVQGTTSDAGKSVLVTALCRILVRHKYRVAPFKPQNMALNSAVAVEGGEIGRAQAVQAEACGLNPSIYMNPVLLKPNSDQGSQVIVNGKPIGNMDATEYHDYKPKLLTDVVAAHQKLSREFQFVLVEGAGSPAEINLRDHDIANMGFAEAIDCPVVIVADIDRGGVFAHLYGTWALLRKSEQKRVKGFIINRFRGDVALLQSGLEWLEQKTSIPVLAVIPYIHNLHIEAEDSISQSQNLQRNHAGERIKVSVLAYPRASNHTDFDVLRMHPQVECEFFREPFHYKGSDLIVLPGSKDVRGDLKWLRGNGWDDVITRHLRHGGKVIGICGGYQMLGKWIHDPNGVESTPGSSQGLGLLALETTLEPTKTLRNVAGHLIETEIPVRGYEIHVGTTTSNERGRALFRVTDLHGDSESRDDGIINSEDSVMGTYLHGLFDEPEMLAHWLAWAGAGAIDYFDYPEYRKAQIERLADEVERCLPLEKLLQAMAWDSAA